MHFGVDYYRYCETSDFTFILFCTKIAMLSDASSDENPEDLAVDQDEVSNDAMEPIEDEANQPEQFNIDLACEHHVNASYLIAFELI